MGTRCATWRRSGRTHHQEPGTRYCDFDDEDSVPELGGSQPDRLIPVSGPQKRVQRHTVEQIIDTFAPVPMLDALVPLVGQLVEVLKINDTLVPDVEQVIEVPKIALEDGIPQRAVLREPQLVEQLVHVSVPELVIPARGRDARGTEWCQVAGRIGVYWWMVRTNNTKWDRPEGFTASAGRYTNTGQG